ncbi:MAG: hypothetical protein RL141_718 [Candidatus Parcubacteria bacterium]
MPIPDMPKPPLTASDFYTYITCPHWPWFDRFASPEDRALKRALTASEERRLDDGVSHERAVMATLIKEAPVRELSTAGDVSALFQATLQAMQEGVETIYQGTLIDGDWHGRPDLLLRQEGASRLGNWHYVPVDIKSSHELKLTHRLQLVFYSVLLQRLQGTMPTRAAIVNRDQEWHWFDPQESMADFTAVLAALERIRAGEKPPLVLRKACMDTSPWGVACTRQAEAAHDIALLYNVDVKKLAALRDLGIHTVNDAATLSVPDIAGAAPGLTLKTVEFVKAQAQALRDRTVFVRLPIAFPSVPLEIYFDIESDQPNDADYLFGFLLADGAKGGTYKAFIAERPEDEGVMWREFLAWVETLPDSYVVYHYAPYEVTRLNLLITRHGGSPALQVFMDRMIDLKPIATKQVVYPLYFYGLKYICKLLGFHWTGELQSGGASIDWYERWCETGDRAVLNGIIQYNEDDVRATQFLKEWLATYAGRVTSYNEPYPWVTP